MSNIELGNIVSIRGLQPKIRMLVIGKAACNDYGFAGEYRRLFWLDRNECPNDVLIISEMLELEGL